MREYTQYYDANGVPFKGFTIRGCGTDTFYREISKEEYYRLSAMSYADVDLEIKKNLSSAVIYGYGYYGHALLEENKMYFLGTTTGNSCD